MEDQEGEVYGLHCECHPEAGIRYIGQTYRGAVWRLRVHRSVARAQSRKSPLVSWIRKHGPDNIQVTVLEVCPDHRDLDDAEVRLIREYRQAGSRLLNLQDGGQVNRRGAKMTEAGKAAISRANRGKKRTAEMRQRQSENFRALGVSVGERNPKAKLSLDDVAAIRAQLAGGIRPTVIAREFGVHSTSIYYIRDGKTWKTAA